MLGRYRISEPSYAARYGNLVNIKKGSSMIHNKIIEEPFFILLRNYTIIHGFFSPLISNAQLFIEFCTISAIAFFV